jgi:hypothetical protein
MPGPLTQTSAPIAQGHTSQAHHTHCALRLRAHPWQAIAQPYRWAGAPTIRRTAHLAFRKLNTIGSAVAVVSAWELVEG